MEWIVLAVIGVLLVVVVLTQRSVVKRINKQQEPQQILDLSHLPPPQVNVNMKPLEDAIKAIPNKVLHSIQSSTNTKKGALGELIGYIELEAQYDRIIPLGNIVDFMCIKFPEITRTGMNKDGVIDEGRVDFVDIKTGKSSRLSKDQRMLQQLIKDKKINFVKVTVNTQTSETEPTTDI